MYGYLSKYLTKDFASAREFNGKRYFASRGLISPEIYRKPAHIKMVLDVIPSDAQFWEPKEPIISEKAGKIYYRRWLLAENLPLVAIEKLFAPNDTSKVGGHDAIISLPTDAQELEPEAHHSVTPFNN
ncbi:hypothetical protein HY633_02730, partial [Candidatus Uhrbacteria bacterium]|nr:hypothetical protein [Candidatus Uhrbacteria bacterium]